jgi:SAM-dependent methyltransferase
MTKASTRQQGNAQTRPAGRTDVVARPEPGAFDALAADYDATFTHTALGRLLRHRVWRTLAGTYSAGQQVLELACGTGEDALWLASRGVAVTATDGSAAMIAEVEKKSRQTPVGAWITAVHCSLQDITSGDWPERPERPLYAGAFSNFGGLNTLQDRAPLAEALATLIRPAGRLVLVLMGPFCPWEMGWYLLHGQPRLAFRRWKGEASFDIGRSSIPIWYPSPGQLRREFGYWFNHLRTDSLGLWLPPTYLGGLVDRQPGLFTWLDILEQASSRIVPGWGDHYVMTLERKA